MISESFEFINNKLTGINEGLSLLVGVGSLLELGFFEVVGNEFEEIGGGVQFLLSEDKSLILEISSLVFSSNNITSSNSV